MSKTGTIEAIDQQHVVEGAAIIATLQIAPRITEAELAAKDLLGIHYECHVAWQKHLAVVFAADPVINDPEGNSQTRKARRLQIVTQMAAHFLANR